MHDSPQSDSPTHIPPAGDNHTGPPAADTRPEAPLAVARSDPLAWAREFLPHFLSHQPAPFHADLMRDLADEGRRFIARIAPRGHAKSTLAALAYPLWAICEQQRRNIVIITHESSLATQFVRDIRNELASNERIRAAYGDLLAPTGPEPAAAPHTAVDAPRPAPRARYPAPRTPRPATRAASARPPQAAPEPPRPALRPARRPTRTTSPAVQFSNLKSEISDATPETPIPESTSPSPKTRTPRASAARKPIPPAAQTLAASPPQIAPPHDNPTSTIPIPKSTRPLRPKCRENLFTTVTGVTVQAKGSGASLRGVRVGPDRPDLIICDDIEKDEQVDSPDGRRKLDHWLRRVVMPALAPAGRLVVLGSLLHHDSLLASLGDRARWPGWDHRIYRAIETAPAADGRLEPVALWPARWPLERLHQERQRIGTLAFEQEYQANPLDDALQVFRPQWLRRYQPQELEALPLANVMAVDPATGASAGDYFALWVGSIDTQTGVIYTRELTVERIGIVDQIKRVLEAFERWRPVRIGIESTGYQAALRQMLDEHSRAAMVYLPIVPIQSLVNKRARIEGSSAFYENGAFRLPETLDPEVESQFLHFPKARHDDAPDVCAMGIELARSLRTATRVEVFIRRNGDLDRRRGW